MATSEIDQQSHSSSIDDDDEVEAKDGLVGMSLTDHLEELRWRIFKSLIAIAIGSVIAFVFRDYIIHFLEAPLPPTAISALSKGNKLIVTGLTEGFTVYLLISVAVGFILALPVVLYQIWAFIAPGLLEKEKKYSVPFIVIGVVLFAAGVSLGYIVLHYPVEWLVTFASDSFTEFLTADGYFPFIAFFLLAFGVVFELPLVLTFLAHVDLLSSQTLVKKRTASHIGMWIGATLLTPGADFYSPIFLGVSLSCLYELSIVFIKITKK